MAKVQELGRPMRATELAGSGEFTPAEVKAILGKRETAGREQKRAGHVQDLVEKAVNRTNPDCQMAQQDLKEWHRIQEVGFLKEALHTSNPDEFLDAETLPISVARLRKMARKFADIALELEATDERIKNLRTEAIGDIQDEVARLRIELAKELLPIETAIMHASMSAVKRANETVR